MEVLEVTELEVQKAAANRMWQSDKHCPPYTPSGVRKSQLCKSKYLLARPISTQNFATLTTV